MSKKGILLCGHGSRKATGTAAFKNLVKILTQRYSTYEVDYGFLEFNHPLYEAAVERLYRRGVREILALPVILFAGAHAKNDIPYELNTIQSYYKDLQIKMGSPIGVHASLLELAKKRILEQAQLQEGSNDFSQDCLLVIGRGTTDPDANSDAHKLMSMLWEGMGFKFGTVAYSGTAYPDVKQGLDLVGQIPFNRIFVVPFFFFTGILLERIYEQTSLHLLNEKAKIICTDSFNTDELLLRIFDERLEEAKSGTGNMNCQLCKYRRQIVGFEQEVGKEQIGHHLNVKGILFEEEEKVGENSKGIGVKLKKMLGL
ncbi:sirohydrochlorin chelatase [Xanthovirga aplysinae]|uniref:sirohydrochlorin chelatase n=1 Tax=Xanthovirga aplysinae TaxID=2529853 RepID=UPI0012BD07B1|nr:sirohydrochlorin chelatase [Xanthovirga aplysinae]